MAKAPPERWRHGGSCYPARVIGILGHIFITAALLLLVANLVRDFELEDATSAILAAVVLGLVNAFLKPVLVLLTIPLTIVTLGLFLFVVNAIVLKITAAVVPGFEIEGFLPAVWGGILLAVFNLGVAWMLGGAL